MSRFMSRKYDALTPYTPGEQPKEREYNKLNTNESPYPPSPLAVRMARDEAGRLELYSDPSCSSLVKTAADILGVDDDMLIFTNGSDDILNFAFMAFCDKGAAFPDITYGFYPVFAALNGVDYTEIPLREDFTIDVNDYTGTDRTVFIANPNAPTGIALPLADIEKIVASDPERVVVVDEAYVDFGGESAIKLTKKYKNLLVTRTFSKSYSLAGGRLGFGIACPELIRDLETIRYSTNPYNINRMTMAAGVGALIDREYFERCVGSIVMTREDTKQYLLNKGCEVLDSSANFLFVKIPGVSGEDVYLRLREMGILVRHFTLERIKDYNRITVGSLQQMRELLEAVEKIMEER